MIAARQIFLGRRGGAKLPYDAEVEWIGQSDQNQYIKTGVVPPVGSILRCEFQFTDTRNSFNAIGNIWNVRFGFGIELGTFKVCTAGWKELIAGKDNNWHTWTIDEPNGIASLDNTSVSINAHSAFTGDAWANNGGFLLFRRLTSTGGGDYATSVARCKSLYIGTSSGALFDGIPVRFTNEQGVSEGAMYDRVSRRLFRNQGTGAFLYGADKVPVETDRYVQDGLVAMWDGKENAGVGLHDPNATEWKDLTGNHVLSYEFTPSFTDNAFELPGTDKVAYCESNLWRDAVNSNQCTVEICFKGYSVGGNNSVIALSRGTTSNEERAWWEWGNVIFGYRISTGSTWSNDTLLPRGETDDVSLSFPLADMYMNGTRVMTGSPGTLNIQSNTLVIGRIGTFKSTINGFVTMRADIHSIRIYNKVLTAAEIAANHAIDKARFNLP